MIYYQMQSYRASQKQVLDKHFRIIFIATSTSQVRLKQLNSQTMNTYTNYVLWFLKFLKFVWQTSRSKFVSVFHDLYR